jgi:nanoRNase/pAp phosphatase (c-di-AMP/oligoRNAs hydrolase)
VLRERDDGSIDVSMRSKRGVSLVAAAQALGGGGHPQASGARLELPMREAAARVRDALATHVALDDYAPDSSP